MKFNFKLGKFRLALGSDSGTRTTQHASRPFTPKSDVGASTHNSQLITRNSPEVQAWLRGAESNATDANAVLVSPFQQSIWVYAVVSALAQTVSAIPFRISKGDRSGETLVTSGPIIDLFNRPHEYLNRFRFWEFIVTWYCLRGEVFIVALDKNGTVLPVGRPRSAVPSLSNPQSAIRNPQSALGCRSGSPEIRTPHSAIRSLLVVPPDQFRQIVDGYELAGWQFTATPLSGPLPAQSFTPEEVLHDFLPNPYLFWRGMSPLSVAMLAAQTDYASAQFMKGLMLNNADTGVIVRTDQQLAPDQREQVLAALRSRKASAGTADRPLLLWGGAEVVKPTLSSADMQFLEHRKFNRQEICAAFFRMPQSLVGFTEDANRAIHQSERLNFIENSITPFCARLEAAVEPIVKSFGQDLVGWFDMDSLPILQQARRDRVDTGVKLFSLGYPANAINKTLDLGLPHIGWGDKGYLPFSLQEAGSGSETAPSPDPNQQAIRPIERTLQKINQLTAAHRASAQSLSSMPKPLGCCGLAVGERAGERKRSSHAFEARLKPCIKAKLRKLSSFLFEQRSRVLASLTKLAKAAAYPRPSASPRPSDGRGIKGEGVLGEGRGIKGEGEGDSQLSTLNSQPSISALFDPAEETQLLLKKLSPLLRSDVELGFTMVGQELSVSGHSLPPEKVVSFLARSEPRFKKVNVATFRELDASLLEGLRNGEPLDQLEKRVKAIFKDATERRAPIIAETETSGAVNAGRMFGMQAANVDKKGWQTADDEKVRDAHAAAESAYAKGIPIDEPFIVGGEALMYPGDDAGSIGNVINCRCYTFPITGGQ